MTTSLLKKLAVVTGLLVLAWGVYIYRQVPHGQAPYAKVLKLDFISVGIEQGGQKTVLLKEKGQWKVFDGAGGPRFATEETRVSELINGLTGVVVEDVIATRADRHAELLVDDPNALMVQVQGPKDKSELSVLGYFGKQAPDMAHIYFRYGGKPEVYLARGVQRSDLGLPKINYWRDRHVLEIPETKIQGIRIEGKGFTTEVVKVSTDSWNVNGKPVDSGLVDALVGVLAHTQVDDFVDPAAYPKLTYEGLSYARLSVKGTDASVDLLVGAQDAKTKRYPVSTGKSFGLAWMSQSALESLLKKPDYFRPKPK